MLLPMLIDTEALKVDIPPGPKLRLDRPGDIDGALQAQVRDPVPQHLEVDGDDARHLDGPAEGDLAVALGEVQVAHRELGPGHVHGEVDLGPARQVLDVAVAAVLGAPGDRPRALHAHLLAQLRARGARVAADGLGGLGHVPVGKLGGRDELALALIPGCEDLRGGGTAEDAGAVVVLLASFWG